METSNLIALGALLVATVGLIPQFYPMLKNKKHEAEGKKDNVRQIKTEEIKKDESKNKEEPMPYMLRIISLVVFAVGTFLIEIILFSIVAHFSNVNVDTATMSLIWKIVFYSLFIIPAAFLFLAFLTFVANTTD